MLLLSLMHALRSVVEFVRYVAAREELDPHEEGRAMTGQDRRRPLAGWIVAREQLVRDGDAPPRGGSFLGWLLAPEALEMDGGPSGSVGRGRDTEASDE